MNNSINKIFTKKEITNKLIQGADKKMITIDWNRNSKIQYDTYKRWIDYWKKN